MHYGILCAVMSRGCTKEKFKETRAMLSEWSVVLYGINRVSGVFLGITAAWD